MPHRTSGSPAQPGQGYLDGQAIRYYRPQGSDDVRRLIDDGFQAFNAGRLSEACHIFTDKMLAPENDTTIGLTMAAGRPWWLPDRAYKPGPRGFHHQHSGESLSRFTLRHEFHIAPRFAFSR